MPIPQVTIPMPAGVISETCCNDGFAQGVISRPIQTERLLRRPSFTLFWASRIFSALGFQVASVGSFTQRLEALMR
jgi:hypothetical protein